MGYYSDVRVATTKKGWEMAKARAKEIYKALYDESMAKATEVKKIGDNCVQYKDERGWFCQVYSELDTSYWKCFGTTDECVMYGFDGLKWLGYDHMEKKAWELAFEEIKEPVHIIMQGEDGETQENYYGEDAYELPYIETGGFVYSPSWNMD